MAAFAPVQRDGYFYQPAFRMLFSDLEFHLCPRPQAPSNLNRFMKKPVQTPSDASHLRAYLEYTVGDFAAARSAIQLAIEADPRNACLHFDRGMILAAMKEWGEARRAFDQAIATGFPFRDAIVNSARAASLSESSGAVGEQKNGTPIARIWSRFVARIRGAADVQFGSQRAWLIPHRDLPEVHDALSLGFLKRGDLEAAEKAGRDAIQREPTAARYFALGTILHRAGRHPEARAAFVEARERGANLNQITRYIAEVDLRLPDYAQARIGYEAVVKSVPDDMFGHSRLLYLASKEGEFERAEHHFEKMVSPAASKTLELYSWEELTTIAYRSIMWPLPPVFERKLINAIDRQLVETASIRSSYLTPPRSTDETKSRIRVGYLSGSLRDHPIGHVTAELFQSHDRAAFEIHVFHTGPLVPSPYTDLIKNGAEHFHHAPGRISAIAATIAACQLDILVYLDGYMDHVLMQVVALRLAPIQLYWLGHAGECALSAIDYFVADDVVIPAGDEKKYRTKILRLPGCYHCASTHPIGRVPSRQQAGLPEAGFVFCAFNNPEKLERHVFEAWMTILDAVEGSVLWLTAGPTEIFERSLKSRAAERGIAPDRLMFANRITDKSDHLARLKHCGLHLDTLTLTASTTALDSLWSGVPVLTVAGNYYASRIATSMLREIGLESLICDSIESYIQRESWSALTFQWCKNERNPLGEASWS